MDSNQEAIRAKQVAYVGLYREEELRELPGGGRRRTRRGHLRGGVERTGGAESSTGRNGAGSTHSGPSGGNNFFTKLGTSTPRAIRRDVPCHRVCQSKVYQLASALCAGAMRFFSVGCRLTRTSSGTRVFRNCYSFLGCFSTSVRIRLAFVGRQTGVRSFAEDVRVPPHNSRCSKVHGRCKSVLGGRLRGKGGNLAGHGCVAFKVRTSSLHATGVHLRHVRASILTGFGALKIRSESLGKLRHLRLLRNRLRPSNRRGFRFR